MREGAWEREKEMEGGRKQQQKEGSCLLACFRKKKNRFFLVLKADMAMEKKEIHMLKQYLHIYLPYTS